MASIRFEAPLIWPQWQAVTPRANQRRDHGFTADLSLPQAIAFLEQEVDELGATGVLYLDIENPLVERLRKKVGSRIGACLRIRLQDHSYVIACDRWQSVEHNIYALHLALRQWRNIERWGIAPLSVLLHGFNADYSISQAASADESAMLITPWMEELGLGPTATLEDAVAVYHRRAKASSNNPESLARLNILMEEIRAYFAEQES